MTVKAASGAEGDTLTMETMSDRLRRVQREPWVRMRYADENSDESWEMYAESLLVRPKGEDGEAVRASHSNEKGKGKATDTDATMDLKEKVPQLEATWNDEEFLQAVSGIKGRIGAVKVEEDEVVEVKRDPEPVKEKAKGKAKVVIKVEDDPPARRGGTRSSTTRTAKSGQASVPMEID
jgi:DNA-directed RNA polymerase III subunit RPC5